MRKSFFRTLAGVLSLLLATGSAAAESGSSVEYITDYQEEFRSQYHFSPASGWIGDPDGYVHYNGKYHLFWWGKATSEDLVHFDQQTIGDTFATIGDPGLGDYYTGGAVVDVNNTAGFGENRLVAIYTIPTRPQKQSISYSTDETFNSLHYYEGNPVLQHENLVEFRDPTVFWDEERGHWTMVIALPSKQSVAFYSSPDLKEWTYLSEFGQMGAQHNAWECPDLIRLKADDGTEKWVLIVSVNPNLEQYFVGEFDGVRFTPDHEVSDYLQHGVGLEGEVFCDFEANDFGGWQVNGDAFGSAPASDESSFSLGHGKASSEAGGVKAKGSLLSPAFVIGKNAINFLAGSRTVSDKASIRLLVDGEAVRSTTPGGGYSLCWNGWDVREFIGKTAQIEIVDDDEYAYIAVDHILFSDTLRNDGLEHAFWVDNGSDFYASRTFRDYDGTLEETSWLGWMGNWTYNNKLPGIEVPGYNAQLGALSIARTLHLTKADGMYRLQQRPVEQLKTLRSVETLLSVPALPQGTQTLSGFMPDSNVYEMDVTFTPGDVNSVFGLNLLVGNGRSLPIRYDAATSCLTVDRSSCTGSDIPGFSCQMSTNVALQEGRLNLHIFVDKKSIEIFVNDGERVFTALTFPSEDQTGIETFSSDSATQLEVRAWMLDSIWPGHIQTKPLLLDDTDESTVYSGEYSYLENKFQYHNSDCHEITNGSVTTTFTGTAIDWYTGVGRGYGIVDIYIDGQLDRVGLDLYSTTMARRKMYSKTELSPGVHTITIQSTGRKNDKAFGSKFDHDSFVYLPIE